MVKSVKFIIVFTLIVSASYAGSDFDFVLYFDKCILTSVVTKPQRIVSSQDSDSLFLQCKRNNAEVICDHFDEKFKKFDSSKFKVIVESRGNVYLSQENFRRINYHVSSNEAGLSQMINAAGAGVEYVNVLATKVCSGTFLTSFEFEQIIKEKS